MRLRTKISVVAVGLLAAAAALAASGGFPSRPVFSDVWIRGAWPYGNQPVAVGNQEIGSPAYRWSSAPKISAGELIATDAGACSVSVSYGGANSCTVTFSSGRITLVLAQFGQRPVCTVSAAGDNGVIGAFMASHTTDPTIFLSGWAAGSARVSFVCIGPA